MDPFPEHDFDNDESGVSKGRRHHSSDDVDRATNLGAAFCWVLLVWLLLTWSTAPDQVLTGVVVALIASRPLAALGPVSRPWVLLRPASILAGARLVVRYLPSMALANARLARRVWSRTIPLRSGMVVVADPTTTAGARTALAVMTSTVVDYQLVAIDDDRRRLKYHGVWIVDGDPGANAARILDGFPGELATLVGS